MIAAMDDELLDLLRGVANGFHKHMQARIAASGTGLPEFQARLINLIGRHDGISQQALAALAERDKAQIARAIKELEMHGHVARRAHASDWRSQCLVLTDKGKATHAELNAIRKNLGAAAVSKLTPAEKQTLKTCLGKIQAALTDQT